MSQRFTYSIPTHALSVLATASHICVSEPPSTPANRPWLRQKTISVSSSRPHTYGVRHLPCGSLDTPFRHTTYRFWPRQATSVWRNLCQHPCRDGSYTFSAKEKDPETGLSYFGSRYYSSDLSVWLSVDPMSDKYPSLSPYVYCADNPVRCVDPNGEDIITIHRDGSYSIKGKKGRDVLVSTESLRIKRLSAQGVFREHVSQEMKENDTGEKVLDKTTFTGLGKEDAQTIFNFLGDYTQVEWGYLESENPDGSKSYFVGSSHNQDEEPLVSNMTYGNIKVLRYDHSHRMRKYNDLEAHRYSKKDIDFWNDLTANHPGATAGIRAGGNTTIYYKNGVKTKAYFNPSNQPK